MAIFTAIAGIVGAINFAGAFVGGFIGGALGLQTATILQLGAIGASLAKAAVFSLASRALQPDINIPRQEIQAISQQTDAPRRVYVGRNLAGGIRALFDVRGGVLYQIIAVSHGHLNRFIGYYVDGEKVTLNDVGYVSSGTSRGWIGTESISSGNGGDYSRIRDKFSYWTANHRLTDVATFSTRMTAPEDFNKVFPKGSQTLVQAEIEGQRVYDPRTRQTKYSDNAALVMLHYLRHPDGFRRTDDEINFDSWAAMADVADQQIPRKGGGTSPRLRLWGYWTLDEEPSQILERMTGSCGIRAYEMQDGRIGAMGGEYGEPACTLTTKDIYSLKRITRVRERSGYNVLRVFHISDKHKYELFETTPWKDTDRVAQEGEIAREYKLEMCPDNSQARRLAKKQIHDDNREEIEIITNLVGLKARYPRWNGQRHSIVLDYAPANGSGRVIRGEYEVKDHKIIGEHRCQITLLKANRETEAWDAEEEGVSAFDLTEFGDDPAPDIEATLTQRTITTSGSMKSAFIDIDVTPVPDRFDLSVKAEYRLIGSETWLPVSGSGFDLETPILADGNSYEVRVRFEGVFTGVDEWEVLGPITIQIDP